MTKKNSTQYSNISDERRLQMDDLRNLGYEYSFDDETDGLAMMKQLSDIDRLIISWDDYY